MYSLKVRGVVGPRQNRSSFEDLFPHFIIKTFRLVTFKSGYAAVVFNEEHQARKLERFINKHNVDGLVVHAIINGVFEYQERKNGVDIKFTIIEGDNEFDTVDPCLKTHLSCTVCMDLLTNPYSTECGHTFCKSCILNWTKSTPSCPVCRKSLKTIKHATIIQNIIDDMQVYCVHKEKGCSWSGKKSEIQKHLNVCSLQTVECTLCRKETERRCFQNHGRVCTGLIITKCDNFARGCRFRGIRQELVFHEKECPFEVIACRNFRNGCDLKCQRRLFPKDHFMYCAYESDSSSSDG